MRTIVYLRKIRLYNPDRIYNTKKEITASITIEFHLPKIITWKRLTKLSVIVGTAKEFIQGTINNDSQLSYMNKLVETIISIKDEEKAGTIKRCYGKLEEFKSRNKNICEISDELNAKP